MKQLFTTTIGLVLLGAGGIFVSEPEDDERNQRRSYNRITRSRSQAIVDSRNASRAYTDIQGYWSPPAYSSLEIDSAHQMSDDYKSYTPPPPRRGSPDSSAGGGSRLTVSSPIFK